MNSQSNAPVDRVPVDCFASAVIRCPPNAHSLGVDNVGWDGTSAARDAQVEQRGTVVADEDERPPTAPDGDGADGRSHQENTELPQHHQQSPRQRQHLSPELLLEEAAVKHTTDSISAPSSSLSLLPSSQLPWSCPATKLEPVAVTLYQDFRRRYGLVRTAEERVAALLGSIVEHMKASAILRLFARIVGAPADGFRQGGEWGSPGDGE